MSKVLIEFNDYTASGDIHLQGFAIRDAEEWKDRMQRMNRAWPEDEEIELEVGDEDRITFEDFDEYDSHYKVKEISNLQADMILQACGDKEFGSWFEVDPDDYE